MLTVVLIEGMSTVHSVRAVFTSLAAVEHVERAHVVLGRAELTHAVPLDPHQIEQALAAAGYRVVAIEALTRHLPQL
jgi:copper chaperone CopZ